MKKILLAAVLFTAVSPVAFSGSARPHVVVTTDPIDGVPAAVVASFNSKFPAAANVKWQVVKTTATVIYIADFYQSTDPAHAKHLQATFAADGTFLGKQRV